VRISLALPALAAALVVLAAGCGLSPSSESATGPTATLATTAAATHSPATQASPATGSGSINGGQLSNSLPNAEACHLLSANQQNAVAGLPPGSVNRWVPADTTSSGMQLSMCSWSDSSNNQGAAIELACGSNVAGALSLMSQAGDSFTADGQTVTIYATESGAVASLAAIGNPPHATISITPWHSATQSVITQALTSGVGVVAQQGCH
jgi:hypothetical protein